MDDRLDPEFSAALRAALLREVRRAPAATGRPAPARGGLGRPVLALGFAVVAVLAIVLGGVVLVQQRSAPPAAPALPFDGDCAAILTSGAASDLIGATVRLQEQDSPLANPLELSLATVGGLSCTWTGAAEPRGDVGLALTVVPAPLRPAGTADRGCFGSGGGAGTQQTCRVDRVAGGRWFSGFVTGAIGGTEAQALAVVADLDGRLAALPAATAQDDVDRSGWWRRLDCDTLDARAHVATALGRPGLTTGSGNGGMTSAGLSAAMTRTGYGNCLALVDGGATFGVELHTYPGAGAAIADALQDPGVRRLADVGDARVYRMTDADGFTSLWAVGAGGVLQLTPSRADDVGTLLPAVAPLLRVLDADARP